LGSFYKDFSHRLVIYLLVSAAYVAGTFISMMIYMGPPWVFENLAYVAAKSLHTTMFFTFSLVAIDIIANRAGPGRFGYMQRNVGRQWLIMLLGFLLAYVLYRAYFVPLVGVYAPWVVSLYQDFPENRLKVVFELLFYLLGWFITAGLVIQFALRSQITATESDEIEITSSLGLGEDGQAPHPKAGPAYFIHQGTNQNLRIPYNEISHVSVEDHYCRLVHISGDKLASHILRMPLNQLESELPDEKFVRIHRSHIVNLVHVTGWRMVRQQRHLVMDHGEQLPISRSRMAELKPSLDRLKLPKMK
jgi:hypothetical protein